MHDMITLTIKPRGVGYAITFELEYIGEQSMSFSKDLNVIRQKAELLAKRIQQRTRRPVIVVERLNNGDACGQTDHEQTDHERSEQ